MVYVILAFAILMAAESIGMLVLVAQKDKIEEDRDACRVALATATAANGSEVQNAARLELVIVDLKREISSLEKDLDTLNSPDATRAVLRRMFASASGDQGAKPVPDAAAAVSDAGSVRGA